MIYFCQRNQAIKCASVQLENAKKNKKLNLPEFGRYVILSEAHRVFKLCVSISYEPFELFACGRYGPRLKFNICSDHQFDGHFQLVQKTSHGAIFGK